MTFAELLASQESHHHANPDTAELELYDYQEDPSETKNVALSRSQVVADLRAVLDRLPEAQPQVTTPARP